MHSGERKTKSNPMQLASNTKRPHRPSHVELVLKKKWHSISAMKKAPFRIKKWIKRRKKSKAKKNKTSHGSKINNLTLISQISKTE